MVMRAAAMDWLGDDDEPHEAKAMTLREAALEQSTTAATYTILTPVAIPSDGATHHTLIASLRLAAKLDRVTAPVLSDEVHLRARVTNGSEHTLLPGRASLFHQEQFVGVTELTTWGPSESVELALGLDDRVRVKRELAGRRVDKTLVGGAARHEAKWRTTVANHSGGRVKVTVLDQAPVPGSPSVSVKDVTTTPRANVDAVGQVTWNLDLANGESAELVLAVKVEAAKGVKLDGWRE